MIDFSQKIFSVPNSYAKRVQAMHQLDIGSRNAEPDTFPTHVGGCSK